MPPLNRLEHYIELVTAIEETASALAIPLIIGAMNRPAIRVCKNY
jgi:uncharacterized protein (DUF2126 family)